MMQRGYFVPMSKGLKAHLPKGRPYSKVEAAFCLQLDYDADKDVSVNGYAALWGWSRSKVRWFLSDMGVAIEYPEDTVSRQNQKGRIKQKWTDRGQIVNRSGKKNEQIRLIDNKQLQPTMDRSTKKNGQIMDRSTATTRDTKIIDNTYTSIAEPSTCPQQAIVDLYHEILPELPRVRIWTEQRQALLRARWKSGYKRESDGLAIATLEFWEGFFRHIRKSDFLMGNALGRNGPFRADLEWMLKKSNFIKILEGKYHRSFGR